MCLCVKNISFRTYLGTSDRKFKLNCLKQSKEILLTHINGELVL